MTLPMDGIKQDQPFSVFKDQKDVLIYGKTNNGIEQLRIDQALNVKKKETFPIKNTEPVIWGNGQQLIYSKDGNLFLSADNQKKVIGKHVDMMKPLHDQVVFSQGKQLAVFDPSIGTAQPLKTFDRPVENIIVNQESSDFISVIENAKKYSLYYFKKEGHAYHSYLLTKISAGPNNTLGGFHFTSENGVITLLYANISFTNGTSRNYYLAHINENKLSQGHIKVNPKRVEVYKKTNSDLITTPKNVDLQMVKGKLQLIFTAEGVLSYHKETPIVYTAYQSGDKWLAVQHSTNTLSDQPLWVNENLITWLGYDEENGTYQVMASSQNQEAIDKSLDVKSSDINQAISNALIFLSINFLVVFLGFVYALPAFVFYLVMYIAKTTAVENGSPFVKWGALVIFFLGQAAFLVTFLSPKLINTTDLPVYMGFPGSLYLYAILIAGFTWLVTRWLKNEDWELLTEVGYFVAVDTLILTFLFGAYTY